MRRLAALALFAVAALTLAATASSVRSVAVFELFRLSLGDGMSRPLAAVPGAGLVADLSPDRSSVLYVNGGVLTVAGIDGSNARRIVDVPQQILAGTWSPDGRTIAFGSFDRTGCMDAQALCGDVQLWVVGPDGGGLRMVADDAADPAWSPDSHRLVFVADYDISASTGRVSVENVDGSGLRTLSRPELALDASWSRDGRSIAYTRVVAGGRRDVVRVVDLGRPGRSRTVGRGERAIWLAPSSRLAILRKLPHDREGLYVTDTARAGLRRLATGSIGGDVVPSPDGRRIAYGAEASVGIVTVAAPSTRKVFAVPRVRGANNWVEKIRWSRDGRSLFYLRGAAGPIHPGP
jgi:Tol biopolymer transport system component